MGSTPLKGTISDNEGGFQLAQVPIGRQTIKITYMGYKEMIMSNVVVNAGKELVLNVGLEGGIPNFLKLPSSQRLKKTNRSMTWRRSVLGRFR